MTPQVASRLVYFLNSSSPKGHAEEQELQRYIEALQIIANSTLKEQRS